MNLLVDVGNTRFKYAFFDEKGMAMSGIGQSEMFDTIQSLGAVRLNIFLSGSGKINDDMRARLKRIAGFWLEASPSLRLPLRIGYLTPETLGFDRIAICVGARNLFPEKDLLVIDSGTAITYNYVDYSGTFLGGNISPGQEIRFRALHLFTEKLPYLEPDMSYGGMGRNTAEAILNGVMDGVCMEVSGYIGKFRKDKEHGQVVVTGGNAHFLKEEVLKDVYMSNYLGFIGLNEILEYNKKCS